MPQDLFFTNLLLTLQEDKYLDMLASDFEVGRGWLLWLLVQEMDAVTPATLPERAKHTIDLYVQFGAPPGSCTKAVIVGDFEQAMAHADSEYRRALPAIDRYVKEAVPEVARGSHDALRAWRGLEATNQVADG